VFATTPKRFHCYFQTLRRRLQIGYSNLSHELEKARLLLQQQEKEIAYLKEINSLMKK